MRKRARGVRGIGLQLTIEGKIGIGLALFALLGPGAIVVYPNQVWIGWAMIAIAVIGFLLLALHHFAIRLRSLLIGMTVRGLGYIAGEAWRSPLETSVHIYSPENDLPLPVPIPAPESIPTPAPAPATESDTPKLRSTMGVNLVRCDSPARIKGGRVRVNQIKKLRFTDKALEEVYQALITVTMRRGFTGSNLNYYEIARSSYSA